MHLVEIYKVFNREKRLQFIVEGLNDFWAPLIETMLILSLWLSNPRILGILCMSLFQLQGGTGLETQIAISLSTMST